jgi:beta-galactosidase
MFRLKVPYEDGEITAVSYDEFGAEIGRYSMKTAGEESVLRVTAEEKEVKKGGLSFVRLQYTDNDGIWQPQGIHNLNVTVENGELLGLGSANPYVKGNYTEDTVRTYFGEAMAVVRAGESGAVRVTVTDEMGDTVCEIPIV